MFYSFFSHEYDKKSTFSHRIWGFLWDSNATFLQILPRIFVDYVKNLSDSFTSNICSLQPHMIFLWNSNATFLQIVPRISAHFINKILNSRNSEWVTPALRHPSGRKEMIKSDCLTAIQHSALDSWVCRFRWQKPFRFSGRTKSVSVSPRNRKLLDNVCNGAKNFF